MELLKAAKQAVMGQGVGLGGQNRGLGGQWMISDSGTPAQSVGYVTMSSSTPMSQTYTANSLGLG
jgi:hypothetical protein